MTPFLPDDVCRRMADEAKADRARLQAERRASALEFEAACRSMAESFRAENAEREAERQAMAWAEDPPCLATSVWTMVSAAIDRCLSGRQSGIVIGTPGTGKTKALEEAVRRAENLEGPRAALITVTAVIGGSTMALYDDLAPHLGVDRASSIAATQKRLMRSAEYRPVVMFDEAQNLTLKSARDLLEISRTAQIPMLFCGNDDVLMRAVTDEARRLAMEVAMPFDKLAAGYEALAAQGRKMNDIRTFMPAVARTAQAAGAGVDDIANSAGAVSEQMQIAGDRMQAAFDIMVKAGNEGKFELKDMARYLPSLAPLAASVGLKGEGGLRRLVSIAQTVRNQTGTAEEAAASLNNIFAKMESDETKKNFKEMGVDLEKGLSKARKEGTDLLTVFVKLADQAIKGDLSKIPQLFKDMEFARGMRALLSQPGAVDRMVVTLQTKADGSTVEALNRVLGDTQTNIDRLSGAWDRFKTKLGEGISPAAVPAMDWFSDTVQMVLDDVERAKRGEMTNAGRRARTIRNLVTTGQGVDQDPAELERARREKGMRDAVDWRREEIDEALARERALAAREDTPLRAGVNPAGRQARLAAIGARTAELERQRASLTEALDALSTLNIELGIAERQSAAARNIRMGQTPAPRGPEFGTIPTADPKRNLSFGINGAPNVRPLFGAPEGPANAPIPPARPPELPRMLDRIEDVLGTASRDMSGTAAKTFDGVNAAVRAGTEEGVKIVRQGVAEMQAALSFTATPTIQPRFSAPVPAGPAAASPSSAPSLAPPSPTRSAFGSPGAGTVTIAAVHVHGVRDLASLEREISRAADREARDARGDALHDTGSYA